MKDSTYCISAAKYFPGDSSILLYSYGNPEIGLEAGYYKYSLSSGVDSLLLPHISEITLSEIINGFDISSDGDKILVPVHYISKTPHIIEYTISTKTSDTLPVTFSRQILWLRYNPVFQNQILYSNYPRGSGGTSVSDDSEIGVFDRQNLQKTILDVNTNPGGLSVNMFPHWSPDGKHIVYGSAKGPMDEPPGAISTYSLYMLKDLD